MVDNKIAIYYADLDVFADVGFPLTAKRIRDELARVYSLLEAKEKEIDRLKKANSDLCWQLYPDRMGS